MPPRNPRVEHLRAVACRFPTDAPEADGTLAWDATTLVLVQAHAAGATGIGWTYAPAAAVSVVEDLLSPVVVGRDAHAPVPAQRRMVAAVRNAGRPGTVGMAISAVDTALWDLHARLHDLPLVELFGGAVGDVELYGSGGFTTYDESRLRSQVQAWLDQDMAGVKIKIGEGAGRHTDRDLDRVRQVRELVGPGVEVFVDANGAYSVGQAVRVGRALDEAGVSWYEEPVSSDDLAGLQHVRGSVDADVAAGEYAHDPTYLARMAPVVDCLQVDVTRVGGYTGWLRSAGVAAGLQVELSGHCAPYLTAPVAAATPGLRHLEYFHDHTRIERMLLEGASEPGHGRLAPAPGAGHGLTVRDDVVADHRIERPR